MTNTNWPDPTRPGVPLFPERDGNHVFEMELYPGFVVWEWSAKNKEYSGISYEAEIVYSPAEMAREYKYFGPVLPPHADKRNAGGGTGAYQKNGWSCV